MTDAAGALVPADRLPAVAGEWRAQGRTVVFTNGVFDLIHPGHLELLAACAEMGDVLLVAINSDASVRRLKGPERPLYPALERAEILLALRWVDAVTVFEADTPIDAIRAARPHVLVKGAEYGSGQIVGEEFVLGLGGRVVRHPMSAGHSTTNIVRRIRGEDG
jgi:D-beta-D-heptose 7-phosphate kinase/D-beta-D-heptose 1-phosphate adenosyltransferase